MCKFHHSNTHSLLCKLTLLQQCEVAGLSLDKQGIHRVLWVQLEAIYDYREFLSISKRFFNKKFMCCQKILLEITIFYHPYRIHLSVIPQANIQYYRPLTMTQSGALFKWFESLKKPASTEINLNIFADKQSWTMHGEIPQVNSTQSESQLCGYFLLKFIFVSCVQHR